MNIKDRPDYVKCIRSPESKHKSYCGEWIMDFMFVDAEHARANRENQGRLLVCHECMKAATRAEAA